jgi:hypothetical protein
MVIQTLYRYCHLSLCAGLLAIIAGCAVTPPVQEMSNARQTLLAAKEARADTFSPSQMREAQLMMDKATGAMEKGDYPQAREMAVTAQKLALKARHEALSLQQRQSGDL